MKIAIAGTGYVGLSLAVLLAQYNEVIAVDINQQKVDLINQKKSPIADKDIEFFLAEKALNLVATLDTKLAYQQADYVVIATPTDYDSENHYFNTSSVEQVIAQVLEINPNAQILLYGSRARGTEHNESDWDLLILLDKDKIEDSDFDQISYPIVELGWKEGEQFSPKLYTMKDWMQRSFTLFYKNIEKEGIFL